MADTEPPIEIPIAELAATTLTSIVESFVLREGTDYGPQSYSLEQKVAHVMAQLRRREAYIVFDPASDSIHIVPPAARPPPIP